MASVDWMKLKVGAMRNLAPHFQQELREKLNHSNQHINKEMTKYNFSIGAKDFYEACDNLDARVKEVDAEHPPTRIKKDRVVGCSLEIVCPQEIADQGIDKATEFFQKSYEALEDLFGKENVCGGFVHFDEVHDYIDCRTKESRKSLYHMNTFIAAYVDEDVSVKKTKKEIEKETAETGEPPKDDKKKVRMTGINGKTFSSRKHMHESNKVMEDLCHEYGIEWHTGEGKNFETIETLKAKSARAERELAEMENQKAQERLTETKNKLDEEEKVLEKITTAKPVEIETKQGFGGKVYVSDPSKLKDLAEREKDLSGRNAILTRRLKEAEERNVKLSKENRDLQSQNQWLSKEWNTERNRADAMEKDLESVFAFIVNQAWESLWNFVRTAPIFKKIWNKTKTPSKMLSRDEKEKSTTKTVDDN